MSQSDLVNTPAPIMSLSADAPEKRKRGRPKKYPRLDFEESVRVAKSLNINRRDITRTLPGFGLANGRHPRQVNQGEGAADLMLGQVVSGVIETVFEAGYLLSVRVGSSGTTLRGVVFKPGHYVPVSAENDVAPNVQMIRRNEIPLKTEGQDSKSRPGNGTFSFNESIETKQNCISATEKQISPVAAQAGHPIFSKVNLLPVLLHPSNLVMGVPISSESSYVATSKGKQVLEASFPSNESTPVNVAFDKEALFSLRQTGQQVNTKGSSHFENDPSSQPPSESLLDDVESKSTKFPGLPFENLVTEVIKKIHPSPLEETQIEFTKLADNNTEEDNYNAARPLVIEPLQAVQLNPPENTESSSKPLENNRTNRMTELLQVLQENMTQSEELPAEVITPDLGLEINEQEQKWGKTNSE